MSGWPAAAWSSHVDAAGTVIGESINQPNGTSASSPSLLERGGGDLAAAWAWSDGVRARVLVSRRTGSQWSAPKTLEDADRTQVTFTVDGSPQVIAAGGRTILLVYQRSSASAAQLLARTSVDGDLWTDAQVLTPNGADSFQLIGNGVGGAVVIWHELAATPTTATMRVFDPGTGWSPPIVPVPGVGGPLAAMHPDGRIALFYGEIRRDGSSSAVLQRFAPQTGWQPAEVVEPSSGGPTALCFAGPTLVGAWYNGQGVVAAFPE